MGLMDKARAAATDLAAKADTALGSSGMRPGASGGDADRYFRDLGVLAYLEATGRPASPEDRQRVMDALKDMDGRGAIGNLALQTSPAPVPPPPGVATPPPPPGGGTAPPPPPGGGASASPPPPQPQTPASVPVAPTAPPPPPPSWMNQE